MQWLSQSDYSISISILVEFMKILVFRPFHFQEKEKTNSSYKHNKKVSHGILNLTFRMLQHTSSEVTVKKYDKI